MIPMVKKYNDPWSLKHRSTAETFWASYSDMMAGLLMIFALTTVITLVDIGERLIGPTEGVREWEQIIEKIRLDKDLQNIKNVKVDPQTGSLVISEKTLRFPFGQTDLGEEAKTALRKAVPKYLEIIFRYPKFLERIDLIEISGHTDIADKAGANPNISRERAGKVLEFLLADSSMPQAYVDLLKEKAVTAGYAATKFPETCKENNDNGKCAEARRVEITIRLNETAMLREFLKILKQVIK